MAHVQVAIYADAVQHERIQREINDWTYQYEGPLGKGVVRPSISEIKYYDIRIPEEFVNQLCADLRVWKIDGAKEFATRKHESPAHILLMRLVNLFRFFTPFKSVDYSHLKPKHDFSLGWKYAYLIGKLDDPIQTDVIGNKREVL